MSQLVEVEVHEGGAGLLRLNRPERRNALTIELMRQLCEQLERLPDEGVRAVVLCGAGPVFCAGLDLVEARDDDVAEESAHWVARTLATVCESPLVTIAAAHGAAMAGGAGLMAACDVVVAASDLVVGFPEVRRGLMPALVSTVLPRRLSAAVMRELLLLAEPVGAERALSIGLVNRLCEPGEVLATARQLAQTACLAAPQALRDTKRLLLELPQLPPSQQREHALRAHTRARNNDEAREGLAAFREKRDPKWSE